MAIVLVLRLVRQTYTVPAGLQQAHCCSIVPGSQDACLSQPPPLLTSPGHPTHLLPTRTESVVRPHHRTHSACLLLLTNYAILRGYLPNHPTLSILRLLKHLHYLKAPSTPPVIYLPLHRPPRTSFRCPMASFYLSSIVPRRFRTLFLLVQRTD
jgi:hypothetical protein